MKVEFCLPVYNEEIVLEKNALILLEFCRRQNFKFDWGVVFVVNGSTDKTLAVSQKLSAEYPGIFTFFEVKESGKGGALKKYWLVSKADVAVFMDVDLSADLNSLPKLVEEIVNNGADISIGSRLLPQATTKRKFLRTFISKSYNWLSRVMLNHDFTDLQCGFKAIKIDSFRQIEPKIIDNAWFFDTELVVLANRAGYKVVEVPISWVETRDDGRKSKLNVMSQSFKFLVKILTFRQRLKIIV